MEVCSALEVSDFTSIEALPLCQNHLSFQLVIENNQVGPVTALQLLPLSHSPHRLHIKMAANGVVK